MSVAYNESQLGGSKRISLNVSELPLEQALKVILKGTGFSYKLKDSYIMIIPEKRKSLYQRKYKVGLWTNKEKP